MATGYHLAVAGKLATDIAPYLVELGRHAIGESDGIHAGIPHLRGAAPFNSLPRLRADSGREARFRCRVHQAE